MAKVIITGASGFLGSWLTQALLEDGHEVYALVRKNSDLSELSKASCKHIYGDVTNLSSLYSAFQGVETVFHLAGLIEYKKSARAKMEKVNVEGTQNVIDAVIKNNVGKLVHLSSVAAIGASFSGHEFLNENSQYNLSHLNLGYFETKRKAENLVNMAYQKKLIDTVILNPSTIYGAGDAKKGSRSTQVKVAQGRFPFYTQGGVNVVAVEDVVAGILAAWKKGRSGERYILASENLTIQKLFQIIAQEANVPEPKILLPNFALHTLGVLGDFLEIFGLNKGISRENAWTASLFHWFDSSKAQRELDFKPKPAQYAISNSVQWMRENKVIP